MRAEGQWHLRRGKDSVVVGQGNRGEGMMMSSPNVTIMVVVMAVVGMESRQTNRSETTDFTW